MSQTVPGDRPLPMAPTPVPAGSGEIAYPRWIEQIHQIEVTSRCNLKCVYCPSPKLDKPKAEGGHERAKVDMEWPVFERALDWAAQFDRDRTQGELALTGIGEGPLHPRFIEMVKAARLALPRSPITFSTNGLIIAQDERKDGLPCGRELLEMLAPYKPLIFVSLHRPEKAGIAVNRCREYGLLADVNAAFAIDAFDWAGQVPSWEVSAKEIECDYLKQGWAVVLSDGRITTCCLDASGAGVVGHVDDAIGSLTIKPYSLCNSCHMSVP